MAAAVTEVAQRIADATARGDVTALAALAIELAQRAAAAESQLAAAAEADRKRRRDAADRKARSRGKPREEEPAPTLLESHVSRDVTGQSVTSHDVARPEVTERDGTRPPLSEGSPVPPPKLSPQHTHTPAREAPPAPSGTSSGNGTGNGADPHGPEAGEAARRYLRASLDDEGLGVIDGYLAAIGARNRHGWHVELARIIGPATGIIGDDLVQAVRDAMLAEPPIKSPGPLRRFVIHGLDERRARARSDNRQAAAGTVRRAGNAPAPSEAGAMFARIRLLEQSAHNGQAGTRRYIPRGDVEALGPRVLAAYDQVGGADRFLNTPGDKLGILLSQFTRAFDAWTPSPPPTEAAP